jgi:hypothetical protein
MIAHPLATQDGTRARLLADLPHKLGPETRSLLVFDCECASDSELLQMWQKYHKQTNIVFFVNVTIQGITNPCGRLHPVIGGK